MPSSSAGRRVTSRGPQRLREDIGGASFLDFTDVVLPDQRARGGDPRAAGPRRSTSGRNRSSICMRAPDSSRCRSRCAGTRSSRSKRTAAPWRMARPACASAECRRRDAGSSRNRSKSLSVPGGVHVCRTSTWSFSIHRAKVVEPSVIDRVLGPNAARRGSCMCRAIRSRWRATSRASRRAATRSTRCSRWTCFRTHRISRRWWCSSRCVARGLQRDPRWGRAG